MKDNLPDRMLRLMSDGSWYSTEELVKKISYLFSATMYVLRKEVISLKIVVLKANDESRGS